MGNKKMKLENQLNKVKNERASQYGSYYENMLLIHLITKDVGLLHMSYDETDVKKLKCIHKFENRKVSHYTLVGNSIMLFTEKILALKAIRSINATGESFKDCIIDFINYINLTKEALNELNLNFNLYLDVNYFNSNLVDLAKGYEVNIDDIDCILTPQGVEYLSKMLVMLQKDIIDNVKDDLKFYKNECK